MWRFQDTVPVGSKEDLSKLIDYINKLNNVVRKNDNRE